VLRPTGVRDDEATAAGGDEGAPPARACDRRRGRLAVPLNRRSATSWTCNGVGRRLCVSSRSSWTCTSAGVNGRRPRIRCCRSP